MQNVKQPSFEPTQFQAAWDASAARAAQDTRRTHNLGEMLHTVAGLHIKSGIEAGGLWGTTSCTCGGSCDCPETMQVCIT